MAKQNTRDALEAKKEADRIFTEKQQLKAQKLREHEKTLKDFNAAQMVTLTTLTIFQKCSFRNVLVRADLFLFPMQAEKSARLQQLRRDEREFEAQKAELIAKEENKFQQYSQSVIRAAAEAQRNVFPLCKATREGIGGGSAPSFSGVRPSYLVQDSTGAQMPKFVSGVTMNIKTLHEAVDIQEAKRRLGFTW